MFSLMFSSYTKAQAGNPVRSGGGREDTTARSFVCCFAWADFVERCSLSRSAIHQGGSPRQLYVVLFIITT